MAFNLAFGGGEISEPQAGFNLNFGGSQPEGSESAVAAPPGFHFGFTTDRSPTPVAASHRFSGSGFLPVKPAQASLANPHPENCPHGAQLPTPATSVATQLQSQSSIGASLPSSLLIRSHRVQLALAVPKTPSVATVPASDSGITASAISVIPPSTAASNDAQRDGHWAAGSTPDARPQLASGTTAALRGSRFTRLSAPTPDALATPPSPPRGASSASARTSVHSESTLTARPLPITSAGRARDAGTRESLPSGARSGKISATAHPLPQVPPLALPRLPSLAAPLHLAMPALAKLPTLRATTVSAEGPAAKRKTGLAIPTSSGVKGTALLPPQRHVLSRAATQSMLAAGAPSGSVPSRRGIAAPTAGQLPQPEGRSSSAFSAANPELRPDRSTQARSSPLRDAATASPPPEPLLPDLPAIDLEALMRPSAAEASVSANQLGIRAQEAEYAAQLRAMTVELEAAMARARGLETRIATVHCELGLTASDPCLGRLLCLASAGSTDAR
jgi:hypothetical protein